MAAIWQELAAVAYMSRISDKINADRFRPPSTCDGCGCVSTAYGRRCRILKVVDNFQGQDLK